MTKWICLLDGGGGALVAQSCPTLATPWTVACQTLLSMGFSRQEYWSGPPCPLPGDLLNSEIKPTSLTSICIGRQVLYQARTLEWVAISFSNAWKGNVKVKSFSRVQLFKTPWTVATRATWKALDRGESESESHSVMSDSLQSHGILQARILEWVAYPFFRGSSQPRYRTGVSCIAGRFFTNRAIREGTEKVIL